MLSMVRHVTGQMVGIGVDYSRNISPNTTVACTDTCAAVLTSTDQLITLYARDFAQDVAKGCGVIIQTPALFVEEIRQLITDRKP